MGIAGREGAIGLGVGWIVLDREKQFRTDVLAEVSESDSSVGEDTGIVISDFQCAACETDAL